MSAKPHFFKLGLFVILSFGLAAAMLIAFGAGKFFKTEFLAETCFDESVQGLDVGSEVKYKGVKIGTVKAITTPTKVYGNPSNYVLVTISLSEDCYVGQTGPTAGDRLKKAIDQGLTVALSFKGITGAAYLETDYQGHRKTPLEITWTPEHLYIPSKRSNIKRVGDALNQLLDTVSALNIKGMGHDLGSLVATLNEKAQGLDTQGLTDQAKGLIAELRTTNDSIGRFLGSDRLTRSMADAQDAFAELKTLVSQAAPPVKTTLKNIESASGQINRMADRLAADERVPALVESLERTVKLLENMIWVNSGTINRAVKNLENSSENLNQLTQELKKYPGRLLLERPPEPVTPQRLKEAQK